MVVDYSKWDKIELSDDSDIEVHPNVDKRSFIKWKQQSIHEQRDKRNADIKSIETQLMLYQAMNLRVDKILTQMPDEDLVEADKISKFLNANFDKNEKASGDGVDPDIVPYNEMVEDLFEQFGGDLKKKGKDPKNANDVRELFTAHRAKIDQVTKDSKVQLDKLLKERSAHISSDDIHTGFDSSFLNKKSSASDEKKAEELASIKSSQTSSTSQSVENLPAFKPNLEFIDYGEDVMKLAPETIEFGRIPAGNYKKSEAYLLDHMPILSVQQKDALMMTAFELTMSGKHTEAYQAVHQSELLAYVREVYDLKKIPFLNIDQMSESIKMFFQRVLYSNSNGKQSFLGSVQSKMEHIKNRVKVMEQEESANGEAVETIQLKSLDDSTELEINLPDFNSNDPEEIERCKIFNKIPKKMQDALKTENLDEINKVFSETPVDEAEGYLELFNQADIIGVKALLENEGQFEKLKDEYHKSNETENKTQPELEKLSIEKDEAEKSSADIVD